MYVLLADERPKVRRALRLLLESQPEMEIVGEATDAAGLMAMTDRAEPDVVLLDWDLPGFDASPVLTALRLSWPQVRVIALSGRPEVCEDALSAGADTFVSKSDPPEKLLEAVGMEEHRRSKEL